jgi:serine/threonine protein kinase
MAYSVCNLVREELKRVAATAGTQKYYPLSGIKRVFEAENNKNLERVYFCDCAKCKADFKLGLGAAASNDTRRQTFEPRELLGKYATVYALLICCYHAGLIRLFQKHRTYLNGTTFFAREHLEFLVTDGVPFPSIIDDILQEQYSFQVRVIERSLEPVRIGTLEVLPIRQDPEQKGKGSFGQVFGFEFASDEYRGEGLRHTTRFARKIFYRNHADDGPAEWFKFLHFDKLHHPHLMSALAAFWYGDQFSIIFDEAEQTLGAYLESDGGLYTPEALWGQVQGLAAGLAHIHQKDQEDRQFLAYHGDLKPANILILKGVMKIADFGLLHIRYKGPQALDDALSLETSRTASTWPYAALKGPGVARDVWSFGAILSEVATFDLQTRTGVEQFRHSRFQDVHPSTPNLRHRGFHHGGLLKPSVSRQLDELQHMVNTGTLDNNCVQMSVFQKQFFAEPFFDLLRRMLYKDPAESPSSELVATTLSEIQRHATRAPDTSTDRSNQRGDVWNDLKAGKALAGPYKSSCQLQVCSPAVLLLEANHSPDVQSSSRRSPAPAMLDVAYCLMIEIMGQRLSFVVSCITTTMWTYM